MTTVCARPGKGQTPCDVRGAAGVLYGSSGVQARVAGWSVGYGLRVQWRTADARCHVCGVAGCGGGPWAQQTLRYTRCVGWLRIGHDLFPIHLLRSIAISPGAAAEFSGAPISRFCSRRRARSSREASEEEAIRFRRRGAGGVGFGCARYLFRTTFQNRL